MTSKNANANANHAAVQVCSRCFRRPNECSCGTGPGFLVDIDVDILPAIQTLNDKHYITKFCCAGHANNPSPYIYFWVDLPKAAIQSLPQGFELVVRKGEAIIYGTCYDWQGGDFETVHAQAMAELLAWCEGLPDWRGAEKPDGRRLRFWSDCADLVPEHASERPAPVAQSLDEVLAAHLPIRWLDLVDRCADRDSAIEGLAANPRTPLPVLERIMQEREEQGELWWASYELASNPSLPAWAFEVLGTQMDEADNFLDNPSTPKSVVKWLVQVIGSYYEDPLLDDNPFNHPAFDETAARELIEDGWAVAINSPVMPVDLLEELYDHRDVLVRILVAECPNAPADLLVRMLGEEQDRDVTAAIFRNRNLPRDYFEALFDAYVEFEADFAYTNLMLRPDATEDDVAAFMSEAKALGCFDAWQDGGSGLRDRVHAYYGTAHAFGQESRDELLAQWANRCLFLARDCGLPALLEGFAASGDPDLRLALAQNAKAPAALLEELAKVGDEQVEKALAQNPATPSGVLEGLYDKGSCLRELAGRSNLPASCLEELSRSGDERIRASVASNPATPVPCLYELAEDDVASVRRGVAVNPNCPGETIRLLALDEDAFVARCAFSQLS